MTNLPDDIVGLYIERRKKNLTDCFDALKARDYTILETVGHQIQGNASTFGFNDLTAIGEKLETSARERNLQLATQCVLEFKDFLSRTIFPAP